MNYAAQNNLINDRNGAYNFNNAMFYSASNYLMEIVIFIIEKSVNDLMEMVKFMT